MLTNWPCEHQGLTPDLLTCENKFGRCRIYDTPHAGDRTSCNDVPDEPNTSVFDSLWQFLIFEPLNGPVKKMVKCSRYGVQAASVFLSRKGIPNSRNNSRPSSSLSVVVTKAMFNPCERVNLSGFSSGNTRYSVKPRL